MLEPRALFSVSLDSAGYTVVTPSKDDRVVYVSSSGGNDSNDGSSPAKAIRSLDHASSLARSGHGDQLLLKRGDTWNGGFPDWNKDGASADDPMVIGAYGIGDRPTVATNGNAAFVSAGNGMRVDHLVIQGIRFAATSRDPDSADFNAGDVHRNGIGVQFFAGGSDLLLEDCEVSHFVTNVVFQAGQGPLSNVRLRRNIIVDAYSDGALHSEGLFADGVKGLTLEGNVFDHNGWNEKIAGAGATIFNHDAYINASCRDVVVKGNVFANAASHGLQARSGGDVEDNLFIANPLGMSYGLVRGDGSPTEGGVSGIINGNVFLGTRDIAGQTRGVGIEIANIKANGPTILSNNVFSNTDGNGVKWQAGGFAALSLAVGSGVNDDTLAVGINDLTIQGNVVYRWAKGLQMQPDMRPGAAGTDGYHHLVVKYNEYSKVLDNPVIDHPAEFNGSQEKWGGNVYDGGQSESKMLRVNGRSLTVDAWSANTAGDRQGALKYAAPDRSLASYAGDAGTVLNGLRQMSATAGEAADARFTAAAVIDYVRAGFENTAASAPRNWKPPTPPTAESTFAASVRTDESSLTITVTYRDDSALDLSTIDGNDVTLVGRGGRRIAATLVSVEPSSDGRSAVATYQIASPAAVWRTKDRGSYKIAIAENEVKDADGFAVESGGIAEGALEVIQVPPPPTVKKVKFARGKKDRPDSLSITFSQDLAGAPVAGDLALAAVSLVDPAAAPTPLDLSAATVTYDVAKRRLTWAFPQLVNGQLPGGSYSLSLRATGVVTAVDAKPLDGNKDGLGGDDYLFAKTLRVKR